MTVQKPRIGYDNLLERFLGQAWATAEDAEYPMENLADWNPATRWIPEWRPTELSNGDFLEWTAGAADDWSLGTYGAVAQDSTNYETGPYCAAVTRSGANDVYFYQDHATPAVCAGRKMVAWFRIKTTTTCKVTLEAGALSAYAFYSGAGAYQWVKASLAIGQTVTPYVRAYITVQSVGTVYVDRAYLVETDGEDADPGVPARAYVYVAPFDDQELSNGDFSGWSLGPAEAPDNWTEIGSGGIAHRSSVNALVGRYSASITRSGTNFGIGQTLSSTALERARGLPLGLGGWAVASTAAQARLVVVATYRDSTQHRILEVEHTGGGGVEWLSGISAEVPHDATALEAQCLVEGTDGTAYFDGVCLTIGAEPDETPHPQPVDYLAGAGHNLQGATISLQGSDDNTNWSNVVSISPTTSKSFWADTDTAGWAGAAQAEYAQYRVKIVAGSATQRPSLGCLAFGERLDLPKFPASGWDPYRRKMKAKTPELDGSVPAGRGVGSAAIPMRLELSRHIAESFVTGALASFWEHAGDSGIPGGKPFFLASDSGGHPTVIHLCYLDDRAELSAALRNGERTDKIVLEMMAVPE